MEEMKDKLKPVRELVQKFINMEKLLCSLMLVIMVVIPIIMLSGGMGAVESQPDIVQRLTMALPSRHFLAFAKAVVFRGAGLDAVWFELSLMVILSHDGEPL